MLFYIIFLFILYLTTLVSPIENNNESLSSVVLNLNFFKNRKTGHNTYEPICTIILEKMFNDIVANHCIEENRYKMEVFKCKKYLMNIDKKIQQYSCFFSDRIWTLRTIYVIKESIYNNDDLELEEKEDCKKFPWCCMAKPLNISTKRISSKCNCCPL